MRATTLSWFPMSTITESVVEQAALAWLESRGWTVTHDSDIAPDTPDAERTDCVSRMLSKMTGGWYWRPCRGKVSSEKG